MAAATVDIGGKKKKKFTVEECSTSSDIFIWTIHLQINKLLFLYATDLCVYSSTDFLEMANLELGKTIKTLWQAISMWKGRLPQDVIWMNGKYATGAFSNNACFPQPPYKSIMASSHVKVKASLRDQL